MNTYIIAFLLASIDTYYSYKFFLKKINNSKTTTLLLFVTSYYIFLRIIDYIQKIS